ncbi:putative ORFan [Cotonvirus japonicus]|uniref:ORFan n=1 Tax=Cotonvirus japonicus TaxID=2811091 RepID=A0ABM7NTH5_9VIRU|nr:putative ORFan [Cotonvirus japonicus]BCS83478.1 putative ORFan [Cotonvirus japonicus]
MQNLQHKFDLLTYKYETLETKFTNEKNLRKKIEKYCENLEQKIELLSYVNNVYEDSVICAKQFGSGIYKNNKKLDKMILSNNNDTGTSDLKSDSDTSSKSSHDSVGTSDLKWTPNSHPTNKQKMDECTDMLFSYFMNEKKIKTNNEIIETYGSDHYSPIVSIPSPRSKNINFCKNTEISKLKSSIDNVSSYNDKNNEYYEINTTDSPYIRPKNSEYYTMHEINTTDSPYICSKFENSELSPTTEDIQQLKRKLFDDYNICCDNNNNNNNNEISENTSSEFCPRTPVTSRYFLDNSCINSLTKIRKNDTNNELKTHIPELMQNPI